MKLYSSVREILSAVLSAAHLPNVMGIMSPAHADIGVWRVPDPSSDRIVHR